MNKRCLSVSLALLCLGMAALGAAQPPGTRTLGHPPRQVWQSTCAVVANPDLCLLIESGRLDDLRWPEFGDYRAQLRSFYQPDYRLAWVANGEPTAQARSVIGALQNSEKAGLRADDYDGFRWKDRLSQVERSSSPTDLARFDLAVTVSAMRYLADVHSGRVSPKYFNFGLDVRHKRHDVAEFLRSRVVAANDAASVLAEVEPPYPGYLRTKAVLERYLEMEREGDPPPLPRVKKPVHPGEAYANLAQLDQRLHQLGDLTRVAATDVQRGVYQGPVVEAVKHFQLRHGLAPDGVLGAATIEQLNVPLLRRVIQLRLALERWRWLPHDLPPRFLSVNIPGFELYAYDNQRVYLTMPVVVGRAFQGDKRTALPEDIHQTPVFMDEMEYVIFRPYWNVPVNIAKKEILPEWQKDPEYLAKHQYEIYDSKRKLIIIRDVLDQQTLDQLQNGDLEFRQKPGPGNALGLIKFVFPNNYDVYLHGTPEKKLFERSRRDYSHGCIRVQDPVALAEWMLRGDAEWTEEHILAATKDQYPTKKKKPKPGDPEEPLQVKLPRPIPVLILYATAYVEDNDDVHFFDDIYEYDKDLDRALAVIRPHFH